MLHPSWYQTKSRLLEYKLKGLNIINFLCSHVVIFECVILVILKSSFALVRVLIWDVWYSE